MNNTAQSEGDSDHYGQPGEQTFLQLASQNLDFWAFAEVTIGFFAACSTFKGARAFRESNRHLRARRPIELARPWR